MKKKSLITMLAAVCLTGVVMVGATLAYLTSTTDVAKNTFTVGKVDIDLTEKTDPDKPGEPDKDWDDTVNGKDMYPGQSVGKKPIVTVNKGSANCFVYALVTGVDELEAQGFEVTGWDSTVWTKTSVPSGNTIGKNGVYKYFQPVTAAETAVAAKSLPAIFNKVTYLTTSEGSELQVAGSIDVKAAAIQSEGITAVDADNEAVNMLTATELAE